VKDQNGGIQNNTNGIKLERPEIKAESSLYDRQYIKYILTMNSTKNYFFIRVGTYTSFKKDAVI
jgi:hypothetical protein